MPQIILFVLTCEKAYNHSFISGIYNIPITIIFFVSSLCFLFFNKIKITKNDMITIVILGMMVVYGFSKESIRYGLVLFSFFVWHKITIKNIDILQKLLVMVAVGFSLLDRFLGYERISGFIAGSPTLFSCAITICFIYFLFKLEKTKSDFLFAAICFVLAIETKSSSSIIFMIALMVYKVIINVFYKFGWISVFTKTCILITIVVVSVLLFLNLESALGIIGRDNRIASTLTRLGIYQVFLDLWMSSVKTFLVGYGGGFTQDYIRQYWGAISHMPLHQDILMFVCEYGVVGFLFIYNYIIKRCKFNFIMILALILASFHNIVLSPASLLLLIITSNSINEQYGKTGILWK